MNLLPVCRLQVCNRAVEEGLKASVSRILVRTLIAMVAWARAVGRGSPFVAQAQNKNVLSQSVKNAA